MFQKREKREKEKRGSSKDGIPCYKVWFLCESSFLKAMLLSHYVPSREFFLAATNSVQAQISIPQKVLRLALELLSGLKPILIVLDLIPDWPSFSNSR